MKKFLPFVIFFLLPLVQLTAQESDCSEIFFSEYVEGSGNSKALEIYNPTNSVVDMSYYWVARYSNGAVDYSSGGITHLQGFLPAHSVFILVNGQTEDVDLGGGNISPKCDPALQDLASHFPYQMDEPYPAPTYMNGNDAIALLKSDNNQTLSNSTAVDLIGQIGLGNAISSEYGWSNISDTTVTYNVHVDSSTVIVTKGKVINYIVQAHDTSGKYFGPFWMAWTKDHTLIRKPSVKHGVTQNPDPFVVTAEWDTVPGGQDVWDSLGTHTCGCNISAVHNLHGSSLQIYTYPNPVTNGQFEVIANRAIRQVMVTNILGQSMYRSEPVKGIVRKIPVTLPADISPGIYLVRILLDGDQLIVHKILVK